jgi:hypothetical protein
MSSVYANLEWVIEERHLDPYELNQETLEALRRARTRRGARKAIERFVRAFDDPHFRVRKGSQLRQSHSDEEPPLSPSLSGSEACKKLGFESSKLDFRLPFDKLDGFERLEPVSPGNPFPAALLTLDDGRRVGFVRLAEFGEARYRHLGESTWEEFRRELEVPCDEACQWRFRRRVAERLLAYLAEHARMLRAQGADALLIDITRNGGGTEWAGIAPRVLTRQPLHCPPFGFVKHPHYTRRIERRVQWLTEEYANPVVSSSTRALVEEAVAILKSQLDAADPPCDRTALFEVANAELDCTQLVRASSCGIFADPDAVVAAASESDDAILGELFHPLDWEFEAGAWEGALLVLVDRHTASASEQFATLLQVNQAAIVIGERTLGAGCGYVNGGVPIHLENIGVVVWMPDCARYRADGNNEIAGVEPDVDIGWAAEGDAAKRAENLRRALNELSFPGVP